MYLSANYWVEQLENADQVLLGQAEITAFNKKIFATDPHMVDLASFPEQFPGHEVEKRIRAVSKPYKTELYDDHGKVLGPEGYQRYTAELGLENIPGTVQVRFALVVKRTDMRTFPTDEHLFTTRKNQILDRFQENGLFPGDAVAVLHLSADKAWLFVQSYNYTAWVRRENIAIGERQVIQQYKNTNQFLVVTGDKVKTSFNSRLPALSELQLEMGIRIPLTGEVAGKNIQHDLDPDTHYEVLLPVHGNDGMLEIEQTSIAGSEDVHQGFIPFTRENIVRQAFKFLGERYGWGHSHNARDCTGFVMEIYKTFGIYMPRNSSQQGFGVFGENTRFTPDTTLDEKLQALDKLDTGDLIYVPAHVLMYISTVDGEPHVIHDVSTFRYTDANGDYYEAPLNGVLVAPFIPLRESKEATYVEKIYTIKRIR